MQEALDVEPLVLRRRWLSAADFITVIGMTLVDVFCASAIAATGASSWLVAASVVAVIVSYAALARLLNSTTVTVVKGGLTLRHGPLPWFGAQALDRDKLVHIRAVSQPLKWDFGGLSRHSIVAMTERGPITIFEMSDIDSARTRETAALVRERLDLD